MEANHRKLKVLHVSPSYYPAFAFGGPIQSVHLLNQYLVKNKVEVDVFTTNAGLEKHPLILLNTWIETHGVRVKYFPYSGYVHYNFSWAMWRQLFKEVKNYSLIHITAVWNFPVLAACAACWWHKKPYIISPRGTLYPETIGIKSSRIKKLYYHLIAKHCLNKAAAIHYTTTDEKTAVETYLSIKAKGFVVPNGIETDFFKTKGVPFSQFLPEITHKKYLLFLGRIHVKKGLDLLLKAHKEVLKQLPDVYVVIAGPDNDGYLKELEKLSADLKISEKIIYTGQLNAEQKRAALQGALLFALPSYSENFGMSVVEAMAAQCPVVISHKVGIAADLQNLNCIEITQTTPESVSNAILKLLNQPHYRQQRAETAVLVAEHHYHIQAVAEKMEKEYREMVS